VGDSLLISPAGYELTPLPSGLWSVRSPSGAVYQVDVEAGTCSCPDARARGHRRACKHVKAVWGLLELVPALKAPVRQKSTWPKERDGDDLS
jgi:hypothetical protein